MFHNEAIVHVQQNHCSPYDLFARIFLSLLKFHGLALGFSLAALE